MVCTGPVWLRSRRDECSKLPAALAGTGTVGTHGVGVCATSLRLGPCSPSAALHFSSAPHPRALRAFSTASPALLFRRHAPTLFYACACARTHSEHAAVSSIAVSLAPPPSTPVPAVC